jgi:mRNA interferase YafQ
MKFDVVLTNKFKKDLKLAKKQNRNVKLLYDIIEKLSNGEKLDPKYKDHPLTNYGNVRDCHIEPDWVLLYEYVDDVLVLLLHRIGSHSNLKI